jgi:copper(I)-binding protein
MILKTLMLAAMSALFAQSAGAANIGIDQAWARATMPGQPVGAVYMVIETDADARLVAVSSPVAARVEMHEMKMDGGVMRMREVEGGLELPRGQAVTLQPGGLHLMLMNLKKPIAPGETIPLTLTLESNGKLQTIEVRAQGRAVSGAMPHAHH